MRRVVLLLAVIACSTAFCATEAEPAPPAQPGEEVVAPAPEAAEPETAAPEAVMPMEMEGAEPVPEAVVPALAPVAPAEEIAPFASRMDDLLLARVERSLRLQMATANQLDSILRNQQQMQQNINSLEMQMRRLEMKLSGVEQKLDSNLLRPR